MRQDFVLFVADIEVGYTAIFLIAWASVIIVQLFYNKEARREDIDMAARKNKTADFNPEGIDSLDQDKPVVYKILDRNDRNIYTGSAKRGRVAERINEQLPGGSDSIPGGAKVKIEQRDSIEEAQKSESRIISRSKPRYNKKGK